jgi:transposase
MAREEYSVELRAQIVTLVMIAKLKPQDVAKMLNIPQNSVYNIVKRAKEHGYDPTVNPRIEHEHIANKKRSGRPKVVTEEIEASIIASITKDRAGREKSAEYLAYEAGISESSVLRLLKFNSLSKCKPTWKPGLTEEMRQARLAFALAHQHWTLEDFKNIIWTDETSVVLGHRRGSNRCWRRPFECYDPTVIRRRYKGSCEFMFWGCFSYDFKGPCHIYQTPTAAQQKKAEKELEIANRAREERAREEWELNNAFSRLQLRPRPGRKPVFKFAPKHGKLVRSSKGGIDWYRYQKV